MACEKCCDPTACCIVSAEPAPPGRRYPLVTTVGIPAVGQCVNVPPNACAHGFVVPGSSLLFRGTAKNITCDRAQCDGQPCLCCCQGTCFEIDCGEEGAAGCVASGGTVVATCQDCGSYNEDHYGACCSQECGVSHCRRMTACECAQNADSAGRRFSYFAGAGTECEEVSRCCVGGEVDPAITSAGACSAAGGSWVTGHACDQHPCEVPPCNCFCDEENPCPEGCTCVDGQCVEGGYCCLNCAVAAEYSTQEDCERCETINYCEEYSFKEDPEQPCPEGWSDFGEACYRFTTPASCDQCSGFCYSFTDGPCGTWNTGIPGDNACDPGWCRESCSLSNSDTGRNEEPTDQPDGSKISYRSQIGVTPGIPSPEITYKAGFEEYAECRTIVLFYCLQFASYQYPGGFGGSFRTEQNATANGRLYEIDCESLTAVDITDEWVFNVADLRQTRCDNKAFSSGGARDLPCEGVAPEAVDCFPEVSLSCENPLP